MHEAPRGTLSHWVVIDKGVFSNYQAVVPTTWNASPRDEKGVPGPYESSLLGNPVIDPVKPLEVFAPSIPSILAWLVPATRWIRPAGKLRR